MPGTYERKKIMNKTTITKKIDEARKIKNKALELKAMFDAEGYKIHIMNPSEEAMFLENNSCQWWEDSDSIYSDEYCMMRSKILSACSLTYKKAYEDMPVIATIGEGYSVVVRRKEHGFKIFTTGKLALEDFIITSGTYCWDVSTYIGEFTENVLDALGIEIHNDEYYKSEE